MVKKMKKKQAKSCNCYVIRDSCKRGAIYGLGLIGALVYYISTASGFWMGVLGVLKSVIWPVFVVHGLLRLIGA